MRQKIDKVEQDFLATFMGELAPSEKVAVDLEPETAEALGIPTVSPASLDALEAGATQEGGQPQAGTGDGIESGPDPELTSAAAAELAANPEVLEVAPFNVADDEPEPDDEIVEPELPTRATHGRMFGNKRSHPLDILNTLSTRYQDEWVDWEPATLWWAIRRDFGTVGIVTRDKIGALRAALLTDLPWQDWDTFENCSLAWNDLVPLVGVFQPMTPAQTAFGVHVLRSIRADELFQNEVNAYIAAILDDDGWVYAPPEYFAGAQELLDRKVWLAGLRHEVEDAWTRIKGADPTAIDWNHSNQLDIHLIKLMAVKHYVDERNAMQGKGLTQRTSASAVQPPVPQ